MRMTPLLAAIAATAVATTACKKTPKPAPAHAIVTRDVDRHELVIDETRLRALLGPIDTPGEAAILASFLGASKVFVPQCDGISRTVVMEKTTAGYSLALEKRVRKGALKKPNGLDCTDCIIAETRGKVVVRPDGLVDPVLHRHLQAKRCGGAGVAESVYSPRAAFRSATARW